MIGNAGIPLADDMENTFPVVAPVLFAVPDSNPIRSLGTEPIKTSGGTIKIMLTSYNHI